MKPSKFSRRRVLALTAMGPAMMAAKLPPELGGPIFSEPKKRYKNCHNLMVIDSNEPGKGRTMLAKGLYEKYCERKSDSAKYMLAQTFVNEMIQSLRTNKMYQFRQDLFQPDLLVIEDAEAFCGKERSQEELYYIIKQRHVLDRWTVITRLMPEGGEDIERRLASVIERSFKVSL